jgi:hypothetical protein
MSVGFGSVAFNVVLPDPGIAGATTTDPTLRLLAANVQVEQTRLSNLAVNPVPWDLHNAMNWAINEWSNFCSFVGAAADTWFCD